MKTLFAHDKNGRRELVIVPSGDTNEIDAGVVYHPLGVDIYDLDMEVLRVELAETLATLGDNVGNTALLTPEQLQRAIFTTVARFIQGSKP